MAPLRILDVNYGVESGRSQELGRAGHQVSAARSQGEAIHQATAGNFDLMILGHNVPAGDRRRIEAEVRRKDAKVLILLLYRGAQERDIFADALVSEEEGPAKLLEAVAALAEKRAAR